MTEIWRRARLACFVLVTALLAASPAFANHDPRAPQADHHIAEQALFEAAQRNNADMVAYALGKGADIEARDTQGLTPLMVAALLGNLNAAEALASAGADLHARETGTGANALHIAAAEGHDLVVRELIAAGASLDAERGSDGRTPLHLAPLVCGNIHTGNSGHRSLLA